AVPKEVTNRIVQSASSCDTSFLMSCGAAAWSVNTFVCYSLGEERARPHFRPPGRLTRCLQARLILSSIRVQQHKSSQKSRESRRFLRAVPNLSGVLTLLLGFRTDRSAPQMELELGTKELTSRAGLPPLPPRTLQRSCLDPLLASKACQSLRC